MGTTWDDIYRNFEKGGDAWATLNEDIHPLFADFLSQTTFPKKTALDIGCGTGKYMAYLRKNGFTTDGIDSSETAVKMTLSTLPDVSAKVVDMFSFQIPANRYDLILSISTIHHGTKDKVAALIQKIYDSLIDTGSIFITLPDWEHARHWNTFKDHEMIGPGTYAPLSGPEQGLAHSFYSKEEVQELFKGFKNVTMAVDSIGRWIVAGSK